MPTPDTSPAPAVLAGMSVMTTDYKGRIYRGFYPRRDPGRGPGWYVFGRSVGGEYGGHLIACCARPDVLPRKHPHYSCEVRRGFHTRREALAAAAALNVAYPA